MQTKRFKVGGSAFFRVLGAFCADVGVTSYLLWSFSSTLPASFLWSSSILKLASILCCACPGC